MTTMLWQSFTKLCFILVALFTTIEGDRTKDDNVPWFEKEPPTWIYLSNNESFFVPCEAKGLQPLKLSWRNESVLNFNVKINATSNGLWFVDGVQHLQGTWFRCMARNSAGVVMGKRFTFKRRYLRSILLRHSSPVLYGNVVRLHCMVDTNYRLLNYSWFKDNIILKLTDGERMQTLPSGVLKIRNYKVSDNGNYSCRVSNGYKEMNSDMLSVQGQSLSKSSLHVYPGRMIRPNLGSHLVVECIHFSDYKSLVIWKKRTKEGMQIVANNSGYADLIFKSILESDGGNYSCMVNGHEKRDILISVESPAIIDRRKRHKLVSKEHDKLVINCSVSGNPPPLVTWYKDGLKLRENARLRFYKNKLRHQLVVNHVVPRDSGIYQCEAYNDYGSNIDDSICRVIEKMDPPLNVGGYAISATMMNITWTIPPGYGNVQFVIHILDYLMKSDFQIVTDDNATYRVIEDLRAFTDYSVFVQMFSGRPRGKSATFWVTTLEARPSGPPNDLKTRSYSKGTLDLTWLPPFIPEQNGKIVGYEVKCILKNGEKKVVNVSLNADDYTTILRNLHPGETYCLKIAARTKAGLGPYSKEVSGVVSSSTTKATIPAPLVEAKHNDTSILIEVNSPGDNLDIIGYILKYKYLAERASPEKKVTINGSDSMYELLEAISNVEYVINIVAFDSRKNYSRPSILVISTKETPTKVNYEMFQNTNYSEQPHLTITCHPQPQSASLLVTWVQEPAQPDTKFEVIYGESLKKTKTRIQTENFNVTISQVTPGLFYEVTIRSIYSVRLYSTSSRPVSHLCKIADQKPASPPRNMSCYVKGSNVVVRWDEPIKPNGHILKYHLWWLTVERKIERKEKDVNVVGMDLKFTVTNVMRSKQFFVNISAENSAGTSPTGHCIVDTSVIPSVQDTNEKLEIKRNTNDIKNGIIIGCLVSCLLLVLLLVFIYWSRKRRLQKEQLILKVENSGNFDAREYKCNKTVYTEFSDGESGKRRIVIKKFIDEETSKESDRGFEMTPKSSYLFLDSEKMPFLQRTVNRDTSADTSCDSQDSGVQTFRNKKFRAHGTHKDSGKLSKPNKDADVVVQTTC